MKSLRDIKGIGTKTELLLGKLQITTLEELLLYFPRTYDVYKAPVALKEAQEGLVNTVAAKVMGRPVQKKSGTRTVIVAEALSEGEKLLLLWFNTPYIRTQIRPGGLYFFRGRIKTDGSRSSMQQPEIFTPETYEPLYDTTMPLYGLTAGLSNKTLQKAVLQVLQSGEQVEEILPPQIRETLNLPGINEAVRELHFPQNKEALAQARKRVIFDEFLLFLLAVRNIKKRVQDLPSELHMTPRTETTELIQRLPYELTGAQQRAWAEIEQEMCSPKVMSRLLQGDVGSGKTILAFLAMLLSSLNGYQAALMAPTEVLAIQHYKALTELLETYFGEYRERVVLLTGSVSAAGKREIYRRMLTEDGLLIVGTHALIQKKAEYKNLGVVITDEQHRFGVKQRELLSTQTKTPHILVMSATPIPRTLAVILYGELSVTTLDELPKERLPIKSCVIKKAERATAYRFLQSKLQEGRQVYVICPLIEENEELSAENVLEYTKTLQTVLGKETKVAALHGKMPAKTKEELLSSFAAGDISVLVSTTVIEVGINVPNATVIMIENAERFGLAQLHQLRGRVGRGAEQSYCIFVNTSENEEENARLKILNTSTDGFKIANEDMKLRGPGDVLGIRQSGILDFRMADVFRDSWVLQEVSAFADELLTTGRLEQDPACATLYEKVQQQSQEKLEL
ncbi:MAG: ATP-dependent DNA helicase RecG [Lachnospiraceae bacterium]